MLLEKKTNHSSAPFSLSLSLSLCKLSTMPRRPPTLYVDGLGKRQLSYAALPTSASSRPAQSPRPPAPPSTKRKQGCSCCQQRAEARQSRLAAVALTLTVARSKTTGAKKLQ